MKNNKTTSNFKVTSKKMTNYWKTGTRLRYSYNFVVATNDNLEGYSSDIELQKSLNVYHLLFMFFLFLKV